MRVITETIAAELVQDNGLNAVRLHGNEGQTIYLAYALVTFGPEEHVFPCSVLDDWGKEMAGLQVYEWIQENGAHFPRAEIFAYGTAGDSRQQFLREFDLYARYPVYALLSPGSDITAAVPITAVLITDPAIARAERTKRPEEITGPLTHARVKWWRVPVDQQGLGFLRTTVESADTP